MQLEPFFVCVLLCLKRVGDGSLRGNLVNYLAAIGAGVEWDFPL